MKGKYDSKQSSRHGISTTKHRLHHAHYKETMQNAVCTCRMQAFCELADFLYVRTTDSMRGHCAHDMWQATVHTTCGRHLRDTLLFHSETAQIPVARADGVDEARRDLGCRQVLEHVESCRARGLLQLLLRNLLDVLQRTGARPQRYIRHMPNVTRDDSFAGFPLCFL